jgi:hypothetical protein
MGSEWLMVTPKVSPELAPAALDEPPEATSAVLV